MSQAASDFCVRAACELAPDGIRVNCVAPGVVNTPMISNVVLGDGALDATETVVGMSILAGKVIQAEDIANCVLFLASDQVG